MKPCYAVNQVHQEEEEAGASAHPIQSPGAFGHCKVTLGLSRHGQCRTLFNFRAKPVLGAEQVPTVQVVRAVPSPAPSLDPEHCRQHRLPPEKILSHPQKPHIPHSKRLQAPLEFPLPSLDNGKEAKDLLSNVRPELSTPEINKYKAQNKTRLDLITIKMIIYFHIKIVMGLMKTSMYFLLIFTFSTFS